MRVFRNRTKKCWSVWRDGRLWFHTGALALAFVDFTVREAARLRIVATGHRVMHAWAEGVIVYEPNVACGRPVQYSPFLTGSFLVGDKIGGWTPIAVAPVAVFDDTGKVWVP